MYHSSIYNTYIRAFKLNKPLHKDERGRICGTYGGGKRGAEGFGGET
jgi:hypothetical protein